MSQAFRFADESLVAFVPTTDPERARTFYSQTLGLPLVSDQLPFALVYNVGGTMLRVTVVHQISPAPYTVLGWNVSDIAAAARSLLAAQVELLRIPGLPQDELGIWKAPGGDQVVWFKDPDGNTLSISQHVAAWPPSS